MFHSVNSKLKVENPRSDSCTTTTAGMLNGKRSFKGDIDVPVPLYRGVPIKTNVVSERRINGMLFVSINTLMAESAKGARNKIQLVYFGEIRLSDSRGMFVFLSTATCFFFKEALIVECLL